MGEQEATSPLARFLADEIRKRGLSMRAASLYAGLPSTAFYHYIKGRKIEDKRVYSTPDPESCIKIADFLKLPQETVLRLAGHIDQPLTAARPIPELEAAVQRAATKPPFTQRLIAQVIAPLVDEPCLALDIPALAGEEPEPRAVVEVHLPPEIEALPERLEDVKRLVEHYVRTGKWPKTEE